MHRRIAAIALVALLVPVLTGCGKEPLSPTPAASQAPAVPPSSTMAFDFSFFDERGAAQTFAAHPNGVEATADASNWINAVVRVVYINLTVADVFSAPVQALNAALSQEPTLGDDGWFVWRYSFTEAGRIVSLRLRARVDGAFVTWQMYATDPGATPALTDFLWFTGESRLTNDVGHWVFNTTGASGPVPVARIDWDATTAGQELLTFRNVQSGSADFGDQLTYRTNGDIAAILFHDASEAEDADITWNERTGTGSLLVPDYNGGLRACWDEHQQNTVCAAEPQL